jgi:hypothetical protein
MSSLLAKLKNVIWTALFALVAAWLTLVAALAGASLEVVLGLGVYALVMAIISPKTP